MLSGEVTINKTAKQKIKEFTMKEKNKHQSMKTTMTPHENTNEI